ncbi:MAG: cell division protein FtsK [Streptosporangiaceae bacterium]|nr:cell division protein FtsK [Streptosporangiaceae bacterium]
MTSYRQMRRRARQARRAGMQPMMFISPGDTFPDLAIAVIWRWVWSYRSALVPFAIALAEFSAAALAHPRHARYWIPVTAVTAAAVLVLACPLPVLNRRRAGRPVARVLSQAWDRCGIPRPIERAYMTAVVAVTGGWLATAIAAGPTMKPLPVAAIIATVVLGIPWWFHRRRRAKVRVERIISWWPDIADTVGLPESRIASAVVDTWGWTARVILKRGTTAPHAITRIPEIESGLGLRPGSVRVFPDSKRADRVIIRVVENDPHAEPIPWPGQWITSVTKPIDIGVSEDGRPVCVLFLRRNVLIGGIMGSGKSGILNIIIANLAGCRDVILWGIDMKGGMELQPWAQCFDRLAFTPDQARELFRDAVELLNGRAARMAAAGQRVWEPTPDDPALIIIVDEYAELPDDAHPFADSVGRRGRAVAVNMIAATQRPTQAAMGSTAVRSQMDIRICLRVREPRDADLILGQGIRVNAGWHAHTLTKPGEFLISGPEHVMPERNRAYLLADARRDDHLSQVAPLRPRPAPSRPDTPRTWPTAGEPPQIAPEPPQSVPEPPPPDDAPFRPEVRLWDALVDAGPEGVSIGELEAACGLTRRWVHYRLREHARAGRVIQVRRGYWRATRPGDSPHAGQPGSNGQ